MDGERVIAKFGAAYETSDNTFIMGIDQRLTRYIASRFRDKIVLESCTGGGFTTIALAGTAKHVFTYEIDKRHQSMAMHNLDLAGRTEKVTFILGDIMEPSVIDATIEYDAAFLDPDWAVTGEDHVYRFRGSNTRPPADKLLELVSSITPNIALVLSPDIDRSEFESLPEHELQSLYLDGEHALYVLYFGELIMKPGSSEHHAQAWTAGPWMQRR